MKTAALRPLCYAIALAIAVPPPMAFAQDAPSSPQQTAAAAPAAKPFKQEEIEALVAPIALYPDELLVQTLMASTYPLEIVQAARWQKEAKNKDLKGEALAKALESQEWDPSVKSIVAFPQVLIMMNDKLDWTQKLGDAFLAQQSDVMFAVQRLRQKAEQSGNLKSNEQQTVVTEKETIIIQPANPQVVYVPTYQPATVYGAWPYPAYPPYYLPPPPGYYAGSAFVSGLAFATGVAVVGSLWGWGNAGWGRGEVNVNVNRYNNINANNISGNRASAISNSSWKHDPSHRKGVNYRDPATRQQYGKGTLPGADGRQDFRGREDAGQRGDRTAGAGDRGGDRTAGARDRGGDRTAGVGDRGGAGGNRGGAGDRGGAGGNRGGAGAGAGAGAAGAGAAKRPTTQPARQPDAFSGMGNGAQARQHSDRGAASRQAAARPTGGGSFGGSHAGGGGHAGGARGGGGGGGMRGGGGRR
jgi:hypothetical protein